jgi:hypothetical protein
VNHFVIELIKLEEVGGYDCTVFCNNIEAYCKLPFGIPEVNEQEGRYKMTYSVEFDQAKRKVKYQHVFVRFQNGANGKIIGRFGVSVDSYRIVPGAMQMSKGSVRFGPWTWFAITFN